MYPFAGLVEKGPIFYNKAGYRVLGASVHHWGMMEYGGPE